MRQAESNTFFLFPSPIGEGVRQFGGRVRRFLLPFLRQGKKGSGVLGAKPLINKSEYNNGNILDNHVMLVSIHLNRQFILSNNGVADFH